MDSDRAGPPYLEAEMKPIDDYELLPSETLTTDKALAELRAKLVGPSVNAIHDAVNHPSHYTSHPSGIECIDVTEAFNFNIGNAIKYLWRSGLKETADSVEDLKKAQWYITREIKRLERNKEK